MKQYFKHIKNIIRIWLLMLSCIGSAQIVINVSGSFNDILSQPSYDNINSSNTALAGQELTNKGSITLVSSIFKEQLRELKSYNEQFDAIETSLKTFVSSSAFSSTRGYNSYGYIQKKYPKINPLSPSSGFKNAIIQLRFSKKLNAERDKIAGYLNKNNPIPEGERVLLVLSSLENVINLTLENEKY